MSKELKEKNSRRRKLSHVLMPDKSLSYPRTMHIEISDACNIHCFMCMREIFDYPNQYLDFELFKSWDKFFDYAEEVTLFGVGEPFMHPNFLDMVELLKSKDCWVSASTNGTLITREKADRLVKCGMDALGISFDAADQETFTKIRKGAEMSRIFESLGYINEAKKKYDSPYPKLEFGFTTMSYNIDQMVPVVRLAAEHGVGKVGITNLIAYKEEMLELSVVETEKFRTNVQEAKRVGAELGIEVCQFYQNPFIGIKDERHDEDVTDSNMDEIKAGFVNLSGELSPKKQRMFCSQPWDGVFIRQDGHVIPCCMLEEYMGNALFEDLESIFQGPEWRNFRRRMRTQTYPRKCAICHNLLSAKDRQVAKDLVKIALGKK